jgi:uncharacterized protein
MLPAAEYWIEKLQLTQHVEGGSYSQTYRSAHMILQQQLPATYHGDRHASTAIYFLLQKNQFSALHRIASDEVWHFYYGNTLVVYEIDVSGILVEHLLGNNPEKGESFQCVVKAGSWFGAKVKTGGDYSLSGCTVAPGFDFADFELAERKELLQLYPQHAGVINMLTR